MVIGGKIRIESPTLNRIRQDKTSVAVLASGGNCPGINKVTQAFTLRMKDHGVPVRAFKNGFMFLQSKSPEEVLKNKKYSFMINDDQLRRLGDENATIFKTSRANPRKIKAINEAGEELELEIKHVNDLLDPKKTEKVRYVINSLEKMKISCLLIEGGNDSNTVAAAIQLVYEMMKAEGVIFNYFQGVNTVPKTIDNDIKTKADKVNTDDPYAFVDRMPWTFGFWSAVNFGGQQFLGFHDDGKGTGDSTVIHIVEGMGRDAGYFTAMCALHGQATHVIFPEEYAHIKKGELPESEIVNEIVDVALSRENADKPYLVVAIAEGVGTKFAVPKDVSKDDHGNIRLDELELATRLSHSVKAEYKRRTGMSVKVVPNKVGYNTRQTGLIAYDTALCSALGVYAADAMLRGNFGCMVGADATFHPTYSYYTDPSFVDPKTLKVKTRSMPLDEGLHYVIKCLQPDFEKNVLIDGPKKA